MITKQQEFLDKLKDPNKALLEEAIRDFLACNENIHAEYTAEYSTGYVVDLMSASLVDLENAADNFVETINKFLNNPGVHVRAQWGDDPLPYTYRRSYYILKESYRPLPW